MVGSTPPPSVTETATLAGGCFWCTEAVFSDLRGVVSVRPGYTGGSQPDPTYEEVCAGTTGHAEAVEIQFHPSEISYADLLRIFFTVHDPTTLDRQGNDEGPQYRSAIFFHSPEQQATARAVRKEIEDEGIYRGSIVTELVPAPRFYPAEEYHHNYFRRHPEQGYCQAVIAPKIGKFRRHYADRLKATS
ncbi:MAG: peptide-methionine (S)-S-oxide reductase MsrA [Thermoplasmata archaeon]